MKWWHWLLALLAVALPFLNRYLSSWVQDPGSYLIVHYGMEAVYIIVILLLGTVIGRVVRNRLAAGNDQVEYERNKVTYLGMAVAFLVAGILCLTTSWVPAWIGNLALFTGACYLGMVRIKKEEKQS
jgi:uncharacterized protein involved in response to NO